MSGPTGRLRRSERLRISRDFQRVARQGTRVACRELVLIVAPSFQARPARADAATSPTAAGPMQEAGKARRLGVTASRKVGNAVVRNRLKRQIREWFRHHRAALPEGVDVVVIARPGAGQLAAADLQARLEDLAGRVRT